MAEKNENEAPKHDDKTRGATATRPAPPRVEKMPPWKVLLHNDDVNGEVFVVETIIALTPLNQQDATQRMFEAHFTGVSLLLTTHKERAELYRDQFGSKGLTVTIEADEA